MEVERKYFYAPIPASNDSSMYEMPYGSVQSANSTPSFDATTVSSLSDLSCFSPSKQPCQSRICTNPIDMLPCLSDSFSDTVFYSDGSCSNMYAGNQCSVIKRQKSPFSEFSPSHFGDTSLISSPSSISPSLYVPMHNSMDDDHYPLTSCFANPDGYFPYPEVRYSSRRNYPYHEPFAYSRCESFEQDSYYQPIYSKEAEYSVFPYNREQPTFHETQPRSTSVPSEPEMFCIPSVRKTAGSEVIQSKKTKKNKLKGNAEHYIIDPQKILRNEDSRQFLMIKNIPNSLTQDKLLAILETYVRYEIEFFYLPLDKVTGCNLGYGYVSLVDHNSVLKLYNAMHHKRWPNSSSIKLCELVYARIQGHRDYVRMCDKWAVMNDHPKYHPIFFKRVDIVKNGIRQTRMIRASFDELIRK